DAVDLQLQEQLNFTVFLAAWAFLTGAPLPLRPLEDVSGLRGALAGALLLLWPAEPEVVVLEHPHGYTNGLRGVVDDVRARNDLRQILAYGIPHLLIVAQPVP